MLSLGAEGSVQSVGHALGFSRCPKSDGISPFNSRRGGEVNGTTYQEADVLQCLRPIRVAKMEATLDGRTTKRGRTSPALLPFSKIAGSGRALYIARRRLGQLKKIVLLSVGSIVALTILNIVLLQFLNSADYPDLIIADGTILAGIGGLTAFLSNPISVSVLKKSKR